MHLVAKIISDCDKQKEFAPRGVRLNSQEFGFRDAVQTLASPAAQSLPLEWQPGMSAPRLTGLKQPSYRWCRERATQFWRAIWEMAIKKNGNVGRT